MKCRNCGTENVSESMYCVNCGTRLNEFEQTDFDIIDEDSDAIDDESIADMERRFTQGIGSWESISDSGRTAARAANDSARGSTGQRQRHRYEASERITVESNSAVYDRKNENNAEHQERVSGLRSGSQANYSQNAACERKTTEETQRRFTMSSESSQHPHADKRSYSERRSEFSSERKVKKIETPEKPQQAEHMNAEERESGRADNNELKKRNVISIFAAAIVLLALILVFILTLPGAGKTPKYEAEIIQSADKEDYYQITVHASVGDRAVFKSSSGEVKELEITSKHFAVFDIHIAELLPQEPIDTPICTVEPIVGIIRKGETEVVKVSVPSVSIDVPQFAVVFDHELELEQHITDQRTQEPVSEQVPQIPDSATHFPETTSAPESVQQVIDADTIVCNEGSVTISGRIPDVDITVRFDDELVEIIGNAFSYTAKFEKAGEHLIQFEASAPGYLTVRRTFKAIVDVDLTAEQVICIDRSFNTRVSSENEEITVVGTVPPGTQLRVVSDDPDFSLGSEPSVDDEGNFSFVVNLPVESKNYQMSIIATTKSGNEIIRPFAVQRPPVFNDYVPTVWACSYNDMIKPMYFGVKGFQINGYVTEIISDADYQRARLQLSTNQTVILNYYNHYAGASTLLAGNNYTMYGYPIGINSDGELELFIWFIRA